ncbi:unnamed protein product, partial [Prorocentrum cordatum]
VGFPYLIRFRGAVQLRCILIDRKSSGAGAPPSRQAKQFLSARATAPLAAPRCHRQAVADAGARQPMTTAMSVSSRSTFERAPRIFFTDRTFDINFQVGVVVDVLLALSTVHAPKEWVDEITSKMLAAGWVPMELGPGLWNSCDSRMIVGIECARVDDAAISAGSTIVLATQRFKELGGNGTGANGGRAGKFMQTGLEITQLADGAIQ